MVVLDLHLGQFLLFSFVGVSLGVDSMLLIDPDPIRDLEPGAFHDVLFEEVVFVVRLLAGSIINGFPGHSVVLAELFRQGLEGKELLCLVSKCLELGEALG